MVEPPELRPQLGHRFERLATHVHGKVGVPRPRQWRVDARALDAYSVVTLEELARKPVRDEHVAAPGIGTPEVVGHAAAYGAGYGLLAEHVDRRRY